MRGKASTWAAFALTLLAALVMEARADDPVYITSGSLRGRALSMGGAYSSIQDDFSSGLYNPASFRVNASRSERPFRLFFNPVGCAAAFNDFNRYDTEYRPDTELTGDEAFLAASLLLKGFVFTTDIADFGLALNEAIPRSDSALATGGRFISAESLRRESFHSAFVNLKIAPTISLGLSGSLYRSREGDHDEYRSGYSFGVLLEPSPKMEVGLTYFHAPPEFSDARLNLERMDGGTVTGGVSFYPEPGMILSVDVRNLNREEQAASLEIHYGAEYTIGNRLALRSGYFRKKDTENDVFSLGAGILPVWGRVAKYRNSARSDILTYAFVRETGVSGSNWHLLTLLWRY